MTEIVLQVSGLSIDASAAHGITRLVDNVSFEVRRHEVFGIVGESGSGKSLTMLAVLGLLPDTLRIVAGSIVLSGQELSTLSFEQFRRIRGKTMSVIFQDPMTSLNPVIPVGAQIAEAIKLHHPEMSGAQIRDRAIELIDLVGIPGAQRRYRQYPHEFSGGMRQRAMIATAMANEPDLLIADEPTTALDVTIQAQVMRVLAEVRERTGAAMVLITHDLGLVAETADRIGVMYGGRMMEICASRSIFARPSHPYTAGLVASLPRMDVEVAELYTIAGLLPDLARRPTGCVFHPRCEMSNGREICRTQVPALHDTGDGNLAACHFAEETTEWAASTLATPASAGAPATPSAGEPVLKVVGLNKEFRIRRRFQWGSERLRAVRNVSFTLGRGRTLGLVGESGCGKSTLGRVLMHLLEASGGRVFLNGEPFSSLRGPKLRARRRDMQVVFQDPYSSLDPRMTVHEIIAEPLRINHCYQPQTVDSLLGQVGLSPEVGRRRPGEFSGGQRQRIAIARALALQPDVLILDEAVSALDVSIQAQIINLLKSLQASRSLTYLFISHDLSVVHHISDEVAVMYLGRLIEYGSARQIFGAPAHPYTLALLSAIPGKARASQVIASGELPNPLAPPSGCAYRSRCFKAEEICAQVEPEMAEHGAPGHLSACHFAVSDYAD